MNQFSFFGMERHYRFTPFFDSDDLPDKPGILTGFKRRGADWRNLYFELTPSLFVAHRELSAMRRFSLRLGETHAAYLPWHGSCIELEEVYNDLIAAHFPPCNSASLAERDWKRPA